MNETMTPEAAFATKPVTKKATKVKAKPVKKGKPAAKASNSQRDVLVKELKRSGGTLETLVKRTKLSDRAVYHHLWHLRNDGLVRSFRDKELNEMLFELTSKGKKIKVN